MKRSGLTRTVFFVSPGAIFSYNDPKSFGMLTFNTEKETAEVQFEVVNLHGEKVYENTFIIGQKD